MTFKFGLLYGVAFCWCFSQSAAINCYQCYSSGNDENSQCLRGGHALSLQRADHMRRNTTSLSRFPQLKNCSHYLDRKTGRTLYNYCKIEMVSSGGNINGYIRDCSNGVDFSADINVTRLNTNLGYLRPDNQTTCGYSHRHIANLCVQLCDTDFCNGPIAAGQNTLTADQSVILTIITVFLNVFLTTIYIW